VRERWSRAEDFMMTFCEDVGLSQQKKTAGGSGGW
jgi:hypothetical protein